MTSLSFVNALWICLSLHFLLSNSLAFSVNRAGSSRKLSRSRSTTTVSLIRRRSTSRRVPKPDGSHSSTALRYVPSSDFHKENDNDDLQQSHQKLPFTMAQDWELMDQLPKFTVGEGEFCRTFWTQMAACTPALANHSPEELLARCQYLRQEQEQQQQQQQQQDDINRNSTRSPSSSSSSFSRPILFGPSPPVLSQWSIEWDRKDSKVVGQLQDAGGRTIWLNYHCIGRLSGDPLSDASSPSVLQLVSGGYLEAMGGRIYELGEARERRTTTTTSSSSSPLLVDHDYSMDTRPPLQQAMDAAKKREKMNELTKKKQGESLEWLFPPVSASVSAFLACTVISACIGYGAGLSIIADDHRPQDQSATSIPTATTTTTTTTTPAKPSTSTSSSTATTTPSLAEQKARAEYRILKEKRLLQRMTERLEEDQKALLELQQQPNGGGEIY